MSETKIWKCDRGGCKSEKMSDDKPYNWAAATILDRDGSVLFKGDLCHKCKVDLEHWTRGERVMAFAHGNDSREDPRRAGADAYGGPYLTPKDATDRDARRCREEALGK